MSDLIFTEQGAGTTPSAGKHTVYYKTDGKLYTKDTTGTEISLPTLTEIAAAVLTLTNKTLTSPVINGFSGTGNGAMTGNLAVTGALSSTGGLAINGGTAAADKLVVYTSNDAAGVNTLVLGSSFSMPQGIAAVVGTKTAAGAGNLQLQAAVSGTLATVATVTSTGLAVTGTLSSTGAVTVTDSTNGINSGSTAGRVRISGGTANNGAVIVLGGSTDGAIPNLGILQVAGAEVARFSSTGLAVTGALSATGSTNLGSDGASMHTFGNSLTYGAIVGGGSAASIYLNGSARGGSTTTASGAMVYATNGSQYFTDAATTTYRMVVSTAGVAVTGTLSSTGALTTAGLKEDTSGNLGLGVTPSAWGSGNTALQIGASSHLASSGNALSTGVNYRYNAGNFYVNSAAASSYVQVGGTHSWYTAPSGTAGNPITFTQAMSLDANGALDLGANGNGAVSGAKQRINTSNANTNALFLSNWTGGATTQGPRIAFDNSGAGFWTIGSGNGINTFDICQAWGTPVMRLDASGNLLVGHTGATDGYAHTLFQGANSQHVIGHAASPTGTPYSVFKLDTGTIGSISQSGTTAVLYNTTSDARLKTNIVDAPDAASLIDALQVRQFDWKSDGSHQRYGFVAQELYEVAPEAVSKPQDPDEMMAVDYSKLVPMLVLEIQSLRQRLATAGI